LMEQNCNHYINIQQRLEQSLLCPPTQKLRESFWVVVKYVLGGPQSADTISAKGRDLWDT
jgi:hypothetical protein